MKKALFVLTIGLFVLVGCTGVKSASSGLENESFLEFIGNPSDYSGGVDVVIDGNPGFNAEVYNDKISRVKGKVYAIPTGKHTLIVSYKSNLLINKQIFITSQETKKIILP